MASDDHAALLSEVDRFAQRRLEPAVARPEHSMDAPTLARLLDEAGELGLLSSLETSGLGPWEEIDRSAPPAATLDVLRHLARANAGFAFAVHQRALANAAARRAGFPGDLAIAPEGSTRLGRVSFARMLAGVALDDADRAVLADVYSPGATRVVPFDAAGLVTPVLDGDHLVLEWHPREDLRVEIDRHAHGLDELPTAVLTPVREAKGRADIDVAPLFAAHQLALVAIATGAIERAHALARRFASQRRQGGALIDRHAAVLGLLGKTRAVLDAIRAQLESHGTRALDTERLFAAITLRSEAHPALADAAHAAMQVFGGIGYMRDTGVEKVARDVNHLRAMAGAPTELALIGAEWERIHG